MVDTSSDWWSISGIVRGCSSQYMTEDQHAHMGLGVHSKTTDIRLPLDFDQVSFITLNFRMTFIVVWYCGTLVLLCFGVLQYPIMLQQSTIRLEKEWTKAKSWLLEISKLCFFLTFIDGSYYDFSDYQICIVIPACHAAYSHISLCYPYLWREKLYDSSSYKCEHN